MRILILNPAFGKQFCKSARWFAKSRGRVQRHPDYLCTAIAVMEQAGNQCGFSDGAARNVSFEETRKIVKDFSPEMVVIQATTPSIYSDLNYSRMCKEAAGKGCLTVMVGAHPSAEPEDTLAKAEGGLDVVSRGEYDYTLKEIADGKTLSEIPGISYFKDGTIIHNPARPLLENLDGLPFPAWHYISPYDYPDSGKLYPFITLISGRGCDAACTFCLFTQVMYGRRYRYQSPERVASEIEYDLRLFPFLKEVMFEDDTFTLKKHRERTVRICEEMLKRNIRIAWSANARPDLTEMEVLKAMKRSGCRMLVVGFEFGNQELLDRVRKGIELEQMQLFSENCRKAGIRIHGCFMIGGPGETRKTARETIRFAQRIKIDTAQFSGLCPYPGTEFYRWCKENGYLVPRDWPDWVDKNLEQKAIVSYPQLPVEEINRLVDRGLKSFYLRPQQMLIMLRNLSSLSDLKTKFYGLKGFLGYFWRKKSK
ncbi:MAG: radical SAM protein [Candidatus Omnitrophota bacterium]